MSTSVDTKQLFKQFDKLEKAVKNKIGKKAITEGAKAAAKSIKTMIPGRVKDARKAIGYSFKKPRSGKFKNMIFAKAGVGAGMKKAKRAKASEAQKKKRKGRSGVGISVSTMHWFVLGTVKRYAGSKRVGAHKRGAKNKRVSNGKKVRYTGRMKPDPDLKAVVKQGARAANVKSVISRELLKGVQKFS